ncbi:nucleotide disphospho-sugar-binding domain-containing protein [Robiginitalea sp. SC105]|uniref:nucleotide disphospho-sugar-binding domain-containing protein n=1 Tax=Robiginitalea sp. SC105 TaxID=2762332 RepID=UPI0016395314|nr:glycosyltransferase [Robiginitalea sp. SC105]
MKILLVSIGTRGDMEPFLAIGEMLRKAGHETICVFPEQFRNLAEEGGHHFESLGPEFMQMLESDTGKAAMGGSVSTWKKLKAYRALQKEYLKISKKVAIRQYQSVQKWLPDRLVHHAKAIYPVIWGLDHPGKTILVSPVPYVLHPVRNYSHIGFNRNLGPFLNRMTFKIGHWGLSYTIRKTAKELPGNPGLSSGEINQALFDTRAVYTVSPALFAQPPEWADHVRVLGYHERDKAVRWKPEPELVAFFHKHPKLLMVTLGSMTNPDPPGKTRIFLNVLKRLGIPALINTAGGGLEPPKAYDTDQFYFVDSIPYDWALPRIYGLVHHGGSGTTHMAAKYGCVSLVIPHIIDQFLWNRLLAAKGLGPKGPAITRLNEERLEPLLKDLWSNTSYKERAGEIAVEMKKEDFREELLKLILD